MSSLPTSQDFATEVKTDRLKILYQGTLILAFVSIFSVLSFGFALDVTSRTGIGISIAILALIGACLGVRWLLKRNRFEWAAWLYGLGWVALTILLFIFGDESARQIVPFIFPVIVFLLGLMLHPVNTFVMTILTASIVIIASMVVEGANFTAYQIIAILLTVMSAVLSSQVTGELYQVTDWALMNYKKERSTNQELFEKRNALQFSLKRQEFMGEELQEKNDELEIAKSAAEEAKHFRGMFLANMSHELRTPLNAIIGFSETMLKFPMMYDDQNLPEAYRTDLSQIFDSGRQLLHVINDILDLARVDAGKLEIHMGATKITPLIEASTTLTKGLIGTKPIQIKKHIPEDLPLVWADESRLRQVLLNVLSNAAKYTDEGFIEVTIEHLDNEIQFKVQDTGIGIHEKYQSTLFEEFQQAENITGRDPRSGAGLGLAITRQLITLMDGNIWFESEIGQGSTFYFTLNIYDGQDKTIPKVTDVTPLADNVSQTQTKRPKGLRHSAEAEKQKLESIEVTN